MTIPADRRYSADHEWVRDGTPLRVGIPAHAADELGDVVFVVLPEVGAQVTAGEVCGEIESTKTVSELFAPVSGEVVAVNAAVLDDPSVVNADPYGDGWLFEVTPSEGGPTVELLDADGYRALIA